MDVVAGKIPNSKFVIGACERFLRDYEKTNKPEIKYFFDPEKAEDYLRKVQQFKHVIGDWSTPENPTNNIIYLDWQCFVFMAVIGFRMKENPRYPRFRTAHIEVPRGHGKSCVASQACLYFVGLDKPRMGSQISCFATKKEQARIVLDSARAMGQKSPEYLKATGVEVQAHKIVHDSSFSFVRPMSSDSNGLDGLNDILSVMDELHQMDRKLFDVVSSGMSKRRDSLMLCITTAGLDTSSVGFTQSQYAKKVCTGDIEDDTFFAIVYTIDEGDDYFEESTWRKANPSFGGSVDPVTFAAKAKKAREVPADLPGFLIKHLNVWISEAAAFFDMASYDKCADPEMKLEDFLGQKCYVGIDLSSKIDLTSFGYVFKKDGIFYIFDKSYIPEATVERATIDLYRNSIESGHLIATSGEAINYEYLRQEFMKDFKRFKIPEAMYDPWAAPSFAQDLTKEKVEMVEFRMNTANLSEPTKHLDALIRSGKIRHNGSPLLRWCMSNVVCKEDNNRNVFPSKNERRLKIDPVIAIIMALARWYNEEENDTSSVYETRGLRTLD